MEEEMPGKARYIRWSLVILVPMVLILGFLALRQSGSLDRLPFLRGAGNDAVESDVLETSGLIEVDEVAVASELGGRIEAVEVAQGDKVASGDLLVRLDTTSIDAQIKVAEAAVAWAEAGLAQAKAGARAGQIAVAEAQLAQAEAAQVAATQAVSDTMNLVENPQDIRLQIAVTQAQAEAVQHHVESAVAVKDAAEIAKNTFEDVRGLAGGSGRHRVHVRSGSLNDIERYLPGVDLSGLGDGVYTFGDFEVHKHGDTYDLYKWVNVDIPLQMHLTPNKWWQAWVGVNASSAQQQGIEAALGQLYSQLQHPQTLEAGVDEALATAAQAKAQIAVAQAQVDALQSGATSEEIAALEARVSETRVALDSLLTQRELMLVTAPLAGVVLDVTAHPGEVAAATAPLLTIADLSEVRLVIYLTEAQVAQVQVGQTVQVSVDSFPNRRFAGEISRIASRAEFTPRNVATEEERATLVYAVEIRLENEDGSLKPGMPADVVLEQ